MPAVPREGVCRFFFCSNEGDRREPPQIHVAPGNIAAEFRLEPVELESGRRRRSHEISELHGPAARRQAGFPEAWHALSES